MSPYSRLCHHKPGSIQPSGLGIFVKLSWITGCLSSCIQTEGYLQEPCPALVWWEKGLGGIQAAGEQEFDFQAQVPSSPACLLWKPEESSWQGGPPSEAFCWAAQREGASLQPSEDPEPRQLNKAVTDTCLGQGISYQSGRRRGRGGGTEERDWWVRGGGERKGRRREGSRSWSRLLILPPPPNPFAKPSSESILINERFTWVEQCF